MKTKGLSQEGLKLLACITMLIDHIGATLVIRLLQTTSRYEEILYYLYYAMRGIGRIAFPIYCFLLVEGAAHTRNPKKYTLRLLVGVLLSEIPFDLALSFYGRIPFDWTSNSVMITLLLGFLMLQGMKKVQGIWQVVMILPFYLLAKLMRTDYSGMGILLIAVFALTRGRNHEKLLLLLLSWLVLNSGMKNIQIFGIWISLEAFAIFALIPIFCYDGRKLTNSKAVQWAFYLFYPVHLLLLALLEMAIFPTPL